MAARLDAIRLDLASAVVDESTGWWRLDGTAALVGVLDYGSAKEFVPASTLAESAAGLIGLPLTVRHPGDGKLLDAKSTRDYQGGSVVEAKFDGERLRVKILLTDERAIAAVQSGVNELSPGYDADVDKTSGEYNGMRYDAIQTARKYNHLALVDRARGGREARLDEEKMKEKITIDGEEFDVDPKVKAHIDSLSATRDAAEDMPPEEVAKDVKMDAEEIAKTVTASVLKELRADRVRTDAEARELGDTVALCRPHLPQSYRTDGKDRGQILGDAIVAISPGMAAAVKSAETDTSRLLGMFEAVSAGASASTIKTDAAAKTDADDEDPVTAAQKRQALRAVNGGKA
jgi:hypothetical protein